VSDHSDPLPDPGPRHTPFEAWLQSVFADSLLWPILVVFALTLATFGSAILTAAVHDRNVSAMAVTALLCGVTLWSLESDLRRRRLGPIAGLVATLWLLSALGAIGLSKLAP
jgi:hypothetical protein